MGGKKNKNSNSKYPMVSICTPTFNRRPFIPMMLKCFEHQDYPKDRIEWLIADDGTDKIEELVSHIPQIKYFKFEEKMTLGKKRNLLNEKAKGDIIVYIDDDDYYPPERISHAVETLKKSKALCAGSSEMFIYFKHINKMIKFGPYGPNHATAATFAFKRELLSKTKFDESSSVAEEKKFLKDYTIPFVQLESKKTILVFSHNQNSFDKKELLNQGPNPTVHETTLLPKDFVKEPEILKFFMEDIDKILTLYDEGKPENKPDVTKQIAELRESRAIMEKEHIKKQIEYQSLMNKINMITNDQTKKNITIEQIQQIVTENEKLKNRITYLENKLKQLINEKVQEKMKTKDVELDKDID
jgi:glycosyltransferase involved in cell wall biosynthesis